MNAYAERHTSLTVVVCFRPHPTAPLGELRRVLDDGGRLVVSFSIPAAVRRLPVTRHGCTLCRPDHMRGLHEDAGFGDVRMAPGTGRRGDFMCATTTKAGAGAD